MGSLEAAKVRYSAACQDYPSGSRSVGDCAQSAHGRFVLLLHEARLRISLREHSRLFLFTPQGWHSQSEWSEGYVSGSGIIRYHLTRVCEETLANVKIAESHPPENVLTLRYEDLVTIFDDVYPSILSFVGLVPSLEAIEAAVEAARGLYVASEGKRITVDVKEVAAIAESVPICEPILSLFSYF
eukprot:m.791206 g.791206  ORF g.791206 m.791206 type:complete len:185 (-) comp59210_c1_seq13:2361-2915(-)